MNELRSSYRFTGGRWVKSEPPQWFAEALAIARTEGRDWQESMSKAGATGVEDFCWEAGGDSIEIYRRRDGEYAICFWDSTQCIADVFIDNMADYLMVSFTPESSHAFRLRMNALVPTIAA